MKHYDERQAIAKYRAGFETFLLGIGICFSMMILMMFHIQFEDMSDVFNTVFLMLIIFYFLRCLQQDAVYEVPYQNRFLRQRIFGYVFLGLGLIVLFLVLWKQEAYISNQMVSSGFLLLIVGAITSLQGFSILRKARRLEQEVEHAETTR
ncbi:MAG: hypothetical protein RR562_04575 [Longicatena sp.]